MTSEGKKSFEGSTGVGKHRAQWKPSKETGTRQRDKRRKEKQKEKKKRGREQETKNSKEIYPNRNITNCHSSGSSLLDSRKASLAAWKKERVNVKASDLSGKKHIWT